MSGVVSLKQIIIVWVAICSFFVARTHFTLAYTLRYWQKKQKKHKFHNFYIGNCNLDSCRGSKSTIKAYFTVQKGNMIHAVQLKKNADQDRAGLIKVRNITFMHLKFCSLQKSNFFLNNCFINFENNFEEILHQSSKPL